MQIVVRLDELFELRLHVAYFSLWEFKLCHWNLGRLEVSEKGHFLREEEQESFSSLASASSSSADAVDVLLWVVRGVVSEQGGWARDAMRYNAMQCNVVLVDEEGKFHRR